MRKVMLLLAIISILILNSIFVFSAASKYPGDPCSDYTECFSSRCTGGVCATCVATSECQLGYTCNTVSHWCIKSSTPQPASCSLPCGICYMPNSGCTSCIKNPSATHPSCSSTTTTATPKKAVGSTCSSNTECESGKCGPLLGGVGSGTINVCLASSPSTVVTEPPPVYDPGTPPAQPPAPSVIKPAQPTGLTQIVACDPSSPPDPAQPNWHQKIVFSWQAVAGADHYRVFVFKNGQAFEWWKGSPITGTSDTWINFPSGQTHLWVVVAYGDSDSIEDQAFATQSNPVSFSIPCTDTACPCASTCDPFEGCKFTCDATGCRRLGQWCPIITSGSGCTWDDANCQSDSRCVDTCSQSEPLYEACVGNGQRAQVVAKTCGSDVKWIFTNLQSDDTCIDQCGSSYSDGDEVPFN